MDENKIEPSIFRYILQHTKKDQCLLLLLTLISMPLVYAGLEIPKIIINSAIGGVDIPEEILGYPIDQIKYLLFLCVIFLVLVLINGGLKYVINVYRGVLGERMLRRFRFDLFSRILRFPVPRFKQVSQGEIIPMITAETEPLGGFIGDAFALPAFQGGLLLTYLTFIFNQDFFLGLAAIALYPPQLYLIPKLQRRVNELSKKRVQAVRRFSDKVGETVSGITDVHVNNTSRYEKALASNRLAEIYSIRFDIYKKKYFIKFLNNFLAQLTPFFFYAIGGYFVIIGKLSLGALVAVLAAYKDLSSPWKELLKFYQITEDTRVKYKQIIGEFQPDNMLNPKLQPLSAEVLELSGPINAASVSYSEDEFVKPIDSVSFTIDPGDHVCILGLGGSGRGVLTQLIARILNPSFGKIKFGDQDIAQLPEAALGRYVSYVDQRSYVFTGTIKENLLYGLKNQPQRDVEYSDDELKLRQLYLKDAQLSANSEDDIDTDWMDLKLAVAQDVEGFNQHILKTLKIAGVENDIYQLGLYSLIDETRHTGLAQGILNARQRLREELLKPEYQALVEILDENRYNTNLTVAENLLFGMPLESGLFIDSVMTNETVQDAIKQAQLKQPLIQIGLQTAKIMVDIFSDVPEGSPLFERFSFVSLEDLPELARLAKISQSISESSLDEKDVNTLMGLAYKLNRSRHRLGLVTTEIQEKIIHAHALIKEKLGESNTLIEFYSQDKIARHLSLQDNILFGRIAYGQANAKQKVGKIIQEVINQLELKDHIVEVGLDYSVGVGGAKLTSSQRQKLTIARALIKNPEIIVINEATAILDHQVEKSVINNILKALPSKTIIWVISNEQHIDSFSKVMILDKGKLVAYGNVEDVKNQDNIENYLSQG